MIEVRRIRTRTEGTQGGETLNKIVTGFPLSRKLRLLFLIATQSSMGDGGGGVR